MDSDWIEGWREEVGEVFINLHSSTSTSKNLEVALDFSKCHTDYSNLQTPVLFVISVLNYTGFKGFRLNDKRYSVYPEEQEVLLMEGFTVYVLEVEEGFEICNKHSAVQKYDGKKITVIYL